MSSDPSTTSQEKINITKGLLDRPISQEYCQFWTDLVSKGKELHHYSGKEDSVVIFRLGREWLALSTSVFRKVTECRSIHSIPHRSGTILRGVANISGHLKMCIDLHRLLEIDTRNFEGYTFNPIVYQRMVLIEKDNECWAFVVDEIYGIFHCPEEELEDLPVTLAKSTSNYLKGLLKWEDRNVGYLDDELLFFSLKRCAT